MQTVEIAGVTFSLMRGASRTFVDESKTRVVKIGALDSEVKLCQWLHAEFPEIWVGPFREVVSANGERGMEMAYKGPELGCSSDPKEKHLIFIQLIWMLLRMCPKVVPVMSGDFWVVRNAEGAWLGNAKGFKPTPDGMDRSEAVRRMTEYIRSVVDRRLACVAIVSDCFDEEDEPIQALLSVAEKCTAYVGDTPEAKRWMACVYTEAERVKGTFVLEFLRETPEETVARLEKESSRPVNAKESALASNAVVQWEKMVAWLSKQMVDGVHADAEVEPLKEYALLRGRLRRCEAALRAKCSRPVFE